MSEFGTGWRQDLEDFDFIERTETPVLFGSTDIPSRFSLREKGARVENQRALSACLGNALALALEGCNYFQTGVFVELSRWFCYISAQIEDGIIGDKGASITGGAKAASKRGVCREVTLPYPSRYTNHLPDAAKKEAQEHLLKSWRLARDHNEVIQFIGSGLGFGLLGMDWRQGIADSRTGEMSERTFRGPSPGGHALGITGYFENEDTEIGNSHGTEWGDGGWGRMTPGLLDYLCRLRQVVLVSDLESFHKPRDFGGMV